jgi:hypothetical protein
LGSSFWLEQRHSNHLRQHNEHPETRLKRTEKTKKKEIIRIITGSSGQRIHRWDVAEWWKLERAGKSERENIWKKEAADGMARKRGKRGS